MSTAPPASILTLLSCLSDHSPSATHTDSRTADTDTGTDPAEDDVNYTTHPEPATRASGSKVRFLSCVQHYDTSSGIAYLSHRSKYFPTTADRAAAQEKLCVTARVSMDLLLQNPNEPAASETAKGGGGAVDGEDAGSNAGKHSALLPAAKGLDREVLTKGTWLNVIGYVGGVHHCLERSRRQRDEGQGREGLDKGREKRKGKGTWTGQREEVGERKREVQVQVQALFAWPALGIRVDEYEEHVAAQIAARGQVYQYGPHDID